MNVIPVGTIIKVNGIPFELKKPAVVSSASGNFLAAAFPKYVTAECCECGEDFDIKEMTEVKESIYLCQQCESRISWQAAREAVLP